VALIGAVLAVILGSRPLMAAWLLLAVGIVLALAALLAGAALAAGADAHHDIGDR
jgi:hypothetical protein